MNIERPKFLNPRPVVFEDQNGAGIPLPSPKFIRFVYALARVFVASGAGAVLDLIMGRHMGAGVGVPVTNKYRDATDLDLLRSIRKMSIQATTGMD